MRFTAPVQSISTTSESFFNKVEGLLIIGPAAAFSRTILPFLKIALTTAKTWLLPKIAAHSVPGGAPWLPSISAAVGCSPVHIWDMYDPWGANVPRQLKGDFHTASVQWRIVFSLFMVKYRAQGLNMNIHNMQSFLEKKGIVWNVKSSNHGQRRLIFPCKESGKSPCHNRGVGEIITLTTKSEASTSFVPWIWAPAAR